MKLTEFIDDNKSAIQSFGSIAASPFGLLYCGVYMNLIEFKNNILSYIHDMIELDKMDSASMTPTQAVTILFEGINYNQPTLC